MKFVELVNEEQAEGSVKEIYGALKQKYGMVPNLMKGFGNSPMALKAYTTLAGTLGEGHFTSKEIEAILLVTAQINQCSYCLAAHTMGLKSAGLSEDETVELRKGTINDPKLQALSQLVREININRGRPGDEFVNNFLNAGYTPEHLVELPVIIALKTMSNYLHNITDIEVDLPAAPEVKEESLV